MIGDELHGQLDTGYPHALRPELHRALVARGIDYWVAQGITFWNRDDGCECLAYGYQADGVPKLAIKVVGFTDPEQAIAATLGESMTDTEKAALERRIDELCAEVEAEKQRNAKLFKAAEKWMAKAAHYEAENAKLRADRAHWELGNCPNCPNIADLQEALEQNAKLRELVDELYPLADYGAMDESELDRAHDLMRELGIEVKA